MSQPLELLKSKLSGLRKTGKGWTAKCPAHDDRQNSLSISEGKDGRALVKCFAGCYVEKILQAVGMKVTDLFPSKPGQKSSLYPAKTSATAQPPGCSLEQYAHHKALPVDSLKKHGILEGCYKGRLRLEIPYRDETGQTVATRYRCALDKSSEGIDDRFRWKTGSHALPYGLWKLKDFKSQKSLVLVEGESDCHTLWHHGIPALGIPGAATWKEEWADYLEDFETVYVVVEPDTGGDATLKWVSRSRLKDKIRLLDLKPFKDPSEIHHSDQTDFKEFWETVLDSSTPWGEWTAVKARKQASDSWDICKDLAKHPNLLDLFVKDLERAGAVGVEREAKILFLSVVSRVLNRPISIAVKGPSSVGKSFLVDKVLKFFPQEAYYVLSAMSEKVLAYTDEPLAHRMLVIVEAAGMRSDMTSYLIRSLLSEGMIRYETVEKTQAGLQARKLETAGPTGLIVTTTEISLHPENETRMFSLTLQDTAEQTKRIISQLADRSPQTVDLNKWNALQAWLSVQDNRVSIPFAQPLADLVPPVAVRLRRDLHQVFTLIETHAILHQASRQRNEQGEILAVHEDYKAVYALIADIIQQQAGAGISPTMRETVEAVRTILEQNGADGFVNQAQLKDRLKLDKAPVSRRTRAAVEAGYLRNEEERKGKPYRLVLGDPLPQEVEILPSPEKLAGCAVVVEKEGYK